MDATILIGSTMEWDKQPIDEQQASPAQKIIPVRACMSTDPIAVQPTVRLGVVLAMMARHGLRHLPVIQSDRTFVGTVNDHDIHAACMQDGDKVLERGVLNMTDLGTPTVGGDDPAEEAWARMSRSPGSNPMPVVTGGKLEGTISQHQLLRALANLPPQDETVKPDIKTRLYEWASRSSPAFPASPPGNAPDRRTPRIP
jgi:CBS domain-containing protein